jgi:hypothetical protein
VRSDKEREFRERYEQMYYEHYGEIAVWAWECPNVIWFFVPESQLETWIARGCYRTRAEAMTVKRNYDASVVPKALPAPEKKRRGVTW